jgi:hypothetical protein
MEGISPSSLPPPRKRESHGNLSSGTLISSLNVPDRIACGPGTDYPVAAKDHAGPTLLDLHEYKYTSQIYFLYEIRLEYYLKSPAL